MHYWHIWRRLTVGLRSAFMSILYIESRRQYLFQLFPWRTEIVIEIVVSSIENANHVTRYVWMDCGKEVYLRIHISVNYFLGIWICSWKYCEYFFWFDPSRNLAIRRLVPVCLLELAWLCVRFVHNFKWRWMMERGSLFRILKLSLG